MEIKRFAIIDADTEQHVASVEAFSEKVAIERFSLVRPLIKLYKQPGSFWKVAELDPQDVSIVPLFNDGFFQVLESVDAMKH